MIKSKPVRSMISILLALTLVFSFSDPVFGQEIATAELKNIEGSVYLNKAGGQREFRAVDGMRVTQGDWIRTDKDGSVSIMYTNGSESVLTANTMVNIKAYEDKDSDRINIRLIVGGVWNKIKQLGNAGSYDLETPTAIMGVRGTLFMARAGVDGQASLDVLEGAVDFQRGSQQGVKGLLAQAGSSLRADKDSSVSMKHQSLDMKELVSGLKPGLQKQMLLDMVERTNDIKTIMGQAKKEFEDYGEEKVARKTLMHSSEIIDIIDLMENFIYSASNSEQGGQFLNELDKDRIKIRDIETELSDIKEISQATWEEVIKNAEKKGIDKKNILPKKKDIPQGDAPGNSENAPGQDADKSPGKSGSAPGQRDKD